jgi:putative ABC transport system substrate-binding protein
MRRREFIGLISGAAAWPVTARAQHPERVRHIGLLTGLAEGDSDFNDRMVALRGTLAALGWMEGRNLLIEVRFAHGRGELFPQLAKELIAQKPDVLFATSGPPAVALKSESVGVPIVFVGASDPIGAGLVSSLARPGGKVTGFLLYEASITGKWLGMLKEIAPSLERAAVIGNPKTVPFDYYLRAARGFGPALGIEVVPSRVESMADIERAIDDIARMPEAGLVFPADSTTNTYRNFIVEHVARRRLPAVYSGRFIVVAGGLMSYDTDRVDMYRRAASYLDRILRGANPADLPVQAPIKFQTIINVTAAKALGLTVPAALLAQADEVIE